MSSQSLQMTSVTSPPTFSSAYLVAVHDVQYQMAAALTLLVWELLLTLEEEIEYVWRMRRCVHKWFYFYFRYFLLAAQMCHLAALPTLSSGSMPDFLCMTWYRYMVCITQASNCMIETILAIRVFAIFNRSRKVGVFLGSLILLELGAAGVNISLCSALEYSEACILPRPQAEMINPFAGITIIVHIILVGMIGVKFVGVRLGWGRTPLLSLLVRDAASYHAMVFLICGISLLISGLDDLRITPILYWSTSLYSAVGCRLIINMERFVRGNRPDEEIVFTSYISL